MRHRNWLGSYLNPHQKKLCRGFIHYLLWQMGFYKDPHPPEAIPVDFSFPNPKEQVNPEEPQVIWINHSSYWVKLAGKSFLLDPVWNERCSPVSFIGPKRHHAPSHKLEELGKLDFVIISHNHYDHLDRKTVLKIHELHPDINWVVPLGLKKWLCRTLPKQGKGWILELDWWEERAMDGFTFTAVPAQHFSGRGLFDRNRTLWMGCVVRSEECKKQFYFAGDTGYNEFDFKKIGEKFRGIDLSLLPIGVYTPRRFMQPVHISPKESLQIHEEVSSKLSVGGHWGTFRLSSDSLQRPPYDLYLALKEKGVTCDKFRVLHPGQPINW